MFRPTNSRAFACALSVLLFTAPVPAQSPDPALLGTAITALASAQQALNQCDLIGARARYAHAGRILALPGVQTDPLRAQVVTDHVDFGATLTARERQAWELQSQLQKLVRHRQWPEAERVLAQPAAQTCHAWYDPWRKAVENGRRPNHEGPGFWSRTCNGFKWALIVGGTVAAGAYTFDRIHKP